MSASLEEVLDGFDRLALEDKHREIQSGIRIERNDALLCHYAFVDNSWCNNTQFLYDLVELSDYTKEYIEVEDKFFATINRYSWSILSINRVENPFLHAQYQMKLKQKQSMYGSVTEHRLFHGTKQSNVDSICSNNFDWRRMGCNGYRFSKYGRGVSFSPSARYALDYPRRCNTPVRTIFVAKVMETSRCQGIPDLIIPPYPHDTSAGGSVIVKYFDNEFYPEYIIQYS